MQTLLKDIRYGMRMLLRTPGFTFVAVLSLALGIGANSTVFSLLDAIRLRSLPIPNPQQLVDIATVAEDGEPHTDFSYPLYAGLRDHSTKLSGMVAYSETNLGLAVGDQTERIRGEFVSANYFPVLGVQPAVGVAFNPEDEQIGAARGAVISYPLWNRLLGGESSVIGKSITLNGRTFSVLGVAPRGFTGLIRGLPTDVWLALPHQAEFEGNPKLLNTPTQSWLSLAGRLQPGVTMQQAQAELSALLPGFSQEAQESGKWSALLRPAAGGNDAYVSELSRPVTMLLIAVALILAIACANVASLMLSRAKVRARDIGVRLALGASRWRIIRQLLTESLMLAALGGMGGLLIAAWSSGLAGGLQTRAAGQLGIDASPNLRVLAFTSAVAVLTVLLFGVVPALSASRVDLVPLLKDSTGATARSNRRRPSLHSLLVVTQVTLSLILLVGAGLFIRSLWKLQSIDKGFAGENVVAMSLNMGLQGFDDKRGAQFYQSTLEALQSTPGIQSASLASALPVSAGGSRVSGPANTTKPAINEPYSVDMISIGPRFFETTGLPLLRGRDFGVVDTEKSEQVIIINESMARKFWPNTEALGQSFSDGHEEFRVVGIARDTKYRNLREAPRTTMYQPLTQSYRRGMTLLVKTNGAPKSIVPVVQARLRQLEPATTIFNVRTLVEHVGRSLYVEQMESTLLILFGLLALVLTAVGIYGVVAYSVAQRTREMGIRMALGAQRKDVLKLILRKGLTLIIWGGALGLVGCYWLSSLVSSQLYEINPFDPLTMTAVVGVLFLVALLASYIPARRATRVDPLVALRYE
ncbi:MAG TPA: ABC transporter permease [Pyrinomonadaceae bacterium]|nr:ABC transporter permease [Pyrinomonadaceae bacterium]